MHVHVECVYMCKCIRICVCIQVYIDTRHTYVYMCMYIYIYINTYVIGSRPSRLAERHLRQRRGDDHCASSGLRWKNFFEALQGVRCSCSGYCSCSGSSYCCCGCAVLVVARIGSQLWIGQAVEVPGNSRLLAFVPSHRWDLIGQAIEDPGMGQKLVTSSGLWAN